MKLNKILVSATVALSSAFMANAQAPEETEYVFQPHWYVQGQVGLQETLGEASFGDLSAFNAQLGVGYRFNPVLGARLVFNGLTSKGAITVDNEFAKWKWNYIAPTANLTVDLTNLIGGFNPGRLVSAGIFGGVGANIAWKNDQAVTANARLMQYAYPEMPAGQARPEVLQLLWTGTKTRFVGQFGAFCDFNVTSNLKIGLELQANVLPDGYNSKKAGNADWYFNGLVGIKYSFGKTYSKRTKALPVIKETEIVEKIVEVPVEKIVVKEVIKEVPAPLTRDVFFKISKSVVTKDEMYKVAEVARYMKQHPDTKVVVTGYADKGTGTMAINLRLSAQRAEAVQKALVNDYGIAADRITIKSMGEVEDQPYPTPQMNRVAICVVE
ncbi:MAG: OmpA family protein [Muribaculaceae bacterium]|nr:OmpA family protein [Muribaculaceae bacterium]